MLGDAALAPAPFRPGDAVCCLAATAATQGGRELQWRVGVVAAADFVPLPGDEEGDGWVITVEWRLVAPGLHTHHDPADLDYA